MAKIGWTNKIDRVLGKQTHCKEKHDFEGVREADVSLCRLLKDARSTGDIGIMTLLEGTILEEEREHFSTGQIEQQKRLGHALDAVNAIETCLDHISSPEKYKILAESYILPSEKINGVPYDSARKGFKHLEKHLKTMSSMPVDGRETLTGIINNRRENNREMERLYTKHQREIMGQESEVKKDRSKGIER